ncbi:16S rRNA (cytidine(1402)-2'-O)-methyltransferase [candidate division KSB1 bacterium]|nr:16S rRNA (cytidine(1402)-2'-O)-methyltransferase [candidate division KSB1 bacterium]
MDQSSSDAYGILYLVSTPIGNLKDITFRAVEILADVDLVAAEDTRHSAILLKHYQINTKTTSYFDFNKEKKTPFLIEELMQGKSIALITDAGTPGISDPAFYLVRAAIEAGIAIETVPGPTAFVSALIVSGLPTDRFVFEGFLPAKKGRQKRLLGLQHEERTIIFYESAQRLLKTLAQLFEFFGDRRICVARELTKKFETISRGQLSEFVNGSISVTARGEFVIVIEGFNDKK